MNDSRIWTKCYRKDIGFSLKVQMQINMNFISIYMFTASHVINIQHYISTRKWQWTIFQLTKAKVMVINKEKTSAGYISVVSQGFKTGSK